MIIITLSFLIYFYLAIWSTHLYKMKKSVIILIILLFGFTKAEQDTSKVIHKDPWIAYDKFLHFSVSASIVLSTQYTLEQKMNYKTEDAMYFLYLFQVLMVFLKNFGIINNPMDLSVKEIL